MLHPAGRAILVIAAVAIGAPAAAQDVSPSEADHDHTAQGAAWTWATDASVFFGYNDQQRKFTDFSAWESQNWFMLTGTRPIGADQLAVDAMISLEPFTMAKLGSPQVFQAGETYNGAPLSNYQHPHDLVMALGGRYRRSKRGVGYSFTADVVGAPALGPTVFLHRESARDNPETPLVHHYTDSTHTTFGVLTGGVDANGFAVEASWFKGEEPDDNRLNIDPLKLDSWSVRGSWQRGPWHAQVSGGHLHRPEPFELYNMARLTASVEYSGAIGSRPFSATLLWGENREIHGILDGYLFEWDLRAHARGAFYGRAEAVAKDLLDLGGPDPPGFVEFHRISHIAALTIGYVYDIADRPWGRLGAGADATLYNVGENLVEDFGSPHSFHVFLRYRPEARSAAAAHVH
jgi:hypothetical protein